MNHSTINIDGVDHRAISPVILSASRSTDIPAFYATWFFNRLEHGYVRWRNPFNQKNYYVDLRNVAGIVFWSKNPKPIIPYLERLDRMGIDYYFQFTVNDYEIERLEPNVPSLPDRLETFKALSSRLGKSRVVWRFDPICLSETINTHDILRKIKNIGDALSGHTEQLVVSFVDIDAYKKVKNNVRMTEGQMIREPNMEEQTELAGKISEYGRLIDVEVFSCGEKHNFSSLNVRPNKCIDGDLFAKICSPNNYKLQKHLGVQTDQFYLNSFNIHNTDTCKDKGQRKECGCIESKDIGMYNTSPHMSEYCYANHSKNIVDRNLRNHLDMGDGIVP